MLRDDRRVGGETRIRLKDIARELGVSTGTVDRALNGKQGISPVTRARVLALAERVGYSPNLAARFLQSRQAIRVSVHLPDQADLFWTALREGIREAAAPFAPVLQLDFRPYTSTRRGDDQVSLLQHSLAERPDGLIVAPGLSTGLAPLLQGAAKRRVPVVCVVTDAPKSPRLLSVAADPFSVGAVAGELLARFLPGRGELGVFTGGVHDHADTLRGFLTSLSAVNPALTVSGIVKVQGDDKSDHRRATALLRAHPKLRGLYISTPHSLAVLRAAEGEGRLGGLGVVATDLFPELVDYIRAGKVAATVDQRPRAQGHLALRTLYQFLQDRHAPPAIQRIAPDIVIGSNLNLALERRAVGPARVMA